MALFFGLAARFSGFALGLFDALAAGAAPCFFLGLPSLFLLANPRIGQCTDARGMFVLGQRA